jgi:hypothetical protein
MNGDDGPPSGMEVRLFYLVGVDSTKTNFYFLEKTRQTYPLIPVNTRW